MGRVDAGSMSISKHFPDLVNYFQHMKMDYALIELNGVGPIDNIPSTNKCHNLFQQKRVVTCDT